MRTNMVGTNCETVTRCRSMSCSAASASNFSIITTEPPSACTAVEKASGAAWYSGAGERYTVWSSTP
jgi:hypothetical protein